MSFSRSVRWTPLVSAIALGLALAACTAGPAQEPATPTTPGASVRATPCGAIAEDIVDAIQRYVDSFATVAAGNLEGASTIGAEQLQTAADRLRRQAEVQGCSSAELTGPVRAELGRLHGGTAVQDAVADTFKADPLGTMDPSDAGAGEFEVNTADELVAAVSQAGSDSVIRLAAGSYDLAAPLIVHRPLTLTGAGPDGTTITSSAASATLLSVIDGDIQLRDLAVEHSGGLGAHVLMVTQGGYDLQRVRISGARVADGTGGFGIVLRPTRATLDSRPTSQRLTEVTLVDNSAGSLVVAGQQAPTIQTLSVTGTDGCGLCYVEDAAGKASDVTISNAAIGVRVDQQAAPALTNLDSTDAQVGLGLTGSGAVKVTDARMSGGAIGVHRPPGRGRSTWSARGSWTPPSWASGCPGRRPPPSTTSASRARCRWRLRSSGRPTCGSPAGRSRRVATRGSSSASRRAGRRPGWCAATSRWCWVSRPACSLSTARPAR